MLFHDEKNLGHQGVLRVGFAEYFKLESSERATGRHSPSHLFSFPQYSLPSIGLGACVSREVGNRPG